jgi:hypothetical protein
VRMLLSASNGHCAYKGGSNCGVHAALGTLITSAAIMDSLIASIFLHCIQHVCLQMDAITRKVRRCHAHRTRICSCMLGFGPVVHAAGLRPARARIIATSVALACDFEEFKADLLAVHGGMEKKGS